jgi:LuxR family transcriptional regulator, quorum-sensing system regulator SolR
VRAAMRQSGQDTVTLSARERDTLCLAAEGHTAWEIGEKLTISVRTVEVYLRNACMKLGASTKTQAVANAIRYGLIR